MFVRYGSCKGESCEESRGYPWYLVLTLLCAAASVTFPPSFSPLIQKLKKILSRGKLTVTGANDYTRALRLAPVRYHWREPRNQALIVVLRVDYLLQALINQLH